MLVGKQLTEPIAHARKWCLRIQQLGLALGFVSTIGSRTLGVELMLGQDQTKCQAIYYVSTNLLGAYPRFKNRLVEKMRSHRPSG